MDTSIDHHELRKTVVGYLTENAEANDYPSFVNDMSWKKYLKKMAAEGTYGDHITLSAVARMFHVQIIVLQPNACGNVIPFEPGNDLYNPSVSSLFLGFTGETNGEHYVSLVRPSLGTDVKGLIDCKANVDLVSKGSVVVSATRHVSGSAVMAEEGQIEQESADVEPPSVRSPVESPKRETSRPNANETRKVGKSTRKIKTAINVKGVANRQFQVSWLKLYGWLESKCENGITSAFCRVCKECETLNLFKFSTKRDGSFTSDGFRNWRNALQKFKRHDTSASHREAVLKLTNIQNGTHVLGQLEQAHEKERAVAKRALFTIITTIQYLARQNIPIRGHTDAESNFVRLLHLRCQDNAELRQWMERRSHLWISKDIQNEILEIMSHMILRSVISEIQSSPNYAVLLDETSDISVREQVSVCVRTVDENFNIREFFLGFYNTEVTDADTLFRILKDVLLRSNLNIQHCRGQCYDGASNVAGMYNGVQAKVLEVSPSALFVHCNNHNLNLAFQDSTSGIPACRDAISFIRELVTMIRESPKRLGIFAQFQDSNSTGLRPLCPTRWTMRVSSIESVLGNYEAITEFLEEQASSRNEFGAKCSGFLSSMNSFSTFFTLSCLQYVFKKLEMTASAMQSPKLNMCDVSDLIQTLVNSLRSKRSDGEFQTFFNEVSEKAKRLRIDEPVVPRVRRRPARFETGTAEAHNFPDPESYYRQMYFEIVDAAIASLETRFNSVSYNKVKDLERSILRCATIDCSDITSITALYSELSSDRLQLHFDMFRDICRQQQMPIQSVSGIVKFLQDNKNVCQLLPEVVSLVRLFLTIPVTTCTVERSFSVINRLITYLRSTLGQARLNHLAILHCYKELTDNLIIEDVYKEFVCRNEIRRKTFLL